MNTLQFREFTSVDIAHLHKYAKRDGVSMIVSTDKMTVFASSPNSWSIITFLSDVVPACLLMKLDKPEHLGLLWKATLQVLK